jgi:hypothetical protein
MTPGARPLAFAVPGIAAIDLWLGLGATRLDLGLPTALSLGGALVALLAARTFWHG